MLEIKIKTRYEIQFLFLSLLLVCFTSLMKETFRGFFASSCIFLEYQSSGLESQNMMGQQVSPVQGSCCSYNLSRTTSTTFEWWLLWWTSHSFLWRYASQPSREFANVWSCWKLCLRLRTRDINLYFWIKKLPMFQSRALSTYPSLARYSLIIVMAKQVRFSASECLSALLPVPDQQYRRKFAIIWVPLFASRLPGRQSEAHRSWLIWLHSFAWITQVLADFIFITISNLLPVFEHVPPDCSFVNKVLYVILLFVGFRI